MVITEWPWCAYWKLVCRGRVKVSVTEVSGNTTIKMWESTLELRFMFFIVTNEESLAKENMLMNVTTTGIGETVSTSPIRWIFFAAVYVFIAYNVLASVVGLVVKIPDVTTTQTSVAHMTVVSVIFSSGTLVSPPFIWMAVLGLLLWGAAANRPWLSRTCTVLSMLAIALLARADVQTILRGRPDLISSSKWTLAVIIGWIFVGIAAVAVASGITWFVRSLAHRRMSVHAA
jgi:hypothetical protein